MSTVLVIAPVVIANWGAITAAVTAVAGTMGYTLARESLHEVPTEIETTNKAEIDLENSEILAGSQGLQQELVIERRESRCGSAVMPVERSSCALREKAVPKVSSSKLAKI